MKMQEIFLKFFTCICFIFALLIIIPITFANIIGCLVSGIVTFILSITFDYD